MDGQPDDTDTAPNAAAPPAAGWSEPLIVAGGGRMGEALVKGLLAAGWRPDRIAVVEVSQHRRFELEQAGYTSRGVLVVPFVGDAVEGLAAGSAQAHATGAELSVSHGSGPGPLGAVLAVKPHDAGPACAELYQAGVRRVLSIAAGVTLRTLEAWLESVAVLRSMPNTAATVGAAASAFCRGRSAGDDDAAWAAGILGAVGTVIEVPERSLDAVTGLSGSGPAYVFLVVEALIDAGVHVGLPRDVAKTLAVATVAGSAKLLQVTGEEASALRANVTSPGGTTAAGLRQLERGAVRAAILDAVVASTERAGELGTQT